MRTTFILLLLFSTTNLIAQEAQTEEPVKQVRKTYIVNPGHRIGEGLLNNGLYQYPKFTEAQVHYKNGNYGNGLLNYNRLTGEMQFIDPNGDTLALNNEPEIDLIAIGKDTFYYSQGYVQKVENFSAKVAKQTLLELVNREMKGLYGRTTQAAINTHTTLVTNQGFKDVIPQEVLSFQEKTVYFIGDRFGRFKPLNKKNVLYLYAKKEKEVSDYLEANPVNF
ncbi:MAG TPA: hypothetical protein VD794_14320, partial [Flavisolibacter sp.]|nr:hypothetical protein [Flavisolibacter sp.]